MSEPVKPEPKAKRSQIKRELVVIGDLVRLLKPFSPEDRKRLLDTANFMMGHST